MSNPATPQPSSSSSTSQDIIQALTLSLQNTSQGGPAHKESIIKLLSQNMDVLSQLVREGKLTEAQIRHLNRLREQLKEVTESHNKKTAAVSSRSPFLHETSKSADNYPISATLATTNPGAVSYTPAQQARPTMTGGIAGGRLAGTPSQIARSAEESNLSLDDTRTRRKSSVADQSMRRSIQDLVASVDPNVKIDPEVEELLLNIADEFIDSATNFSCRLAKHRGGDTLEIKDLQLHLERNHNIRIPGFSSDDTKISMSQVQAAAGVASAVAAGSSGGSGGGKKGGAGAGATRRSTRLAQVQQAKREAKLL